jgi:3-deoxy-manno-octulosonate cytidylyltransferase (CMP-KDO synthetase)
MGSTRLPQKPLAHIKGKPMVAWVYEQAKQCTAFDKIVVATDHQDIVDIITDLGGTAILTPSNIQTGTDRVAYVANLEAYADADIFVNLQGDQPFVSKRMLEQLIAPYLQNELPPMTTLACPLDVKTDYNNANIVKVITDQTQHALYFSRSPIPYFRSNKNDDVPVYHHLGLYAFQRYFLNIFSQLPQSPLEKAEQLEQLRALENGYRIRVCLTEKTDRIMEINTSEELAIAQFAMIDD